MAQNQKRIDDTMADLNEAVKLIRRAAVHLPLIDLGRKGSSRTQADALWISAEAVEKVFNLLNNLD